MPSGQQSFAELKTVYWMDGYGNTSAYVQPGSRRSSTCTGAARERGNDQVVRHSTATEGLKQFSNFGTLLG
eukprot:33912-Chlamydomonas_euryale.AAC.2